VDYMILQFKGTSFHHKPVKARNLKICSSKEKGYIRQKNNCRNMEINTIRERRKRKLDDAQLSLIEHLKSVKTTNEFPSLRELVFQSIAKNIESWITAEVENKDQNYESPFECL